MLDEKVGNYLLFSFSPPPSFTDYLWFSPRSWNRKEQRSTAPSIVLSHQRTSWVRHKSRLYFSPSPPLCLSFISSFAVETILYLHFLNPLSPFTLSHPHGLRGLLSWDMCLFLLLWPSSVRRRSLYGGSLSCFQSSPCRTLPSSPIGRDLLDISCCFTLFVFSTLYSLLSL